MSFNLVETVKGLISGEMIEKASSFLGESESGVGKAVSGILPVLLGGLADKSSTSEGAETVARLAGEEQQAGIIENLSGFFGGDTEGLVNKGSSFLSGIFGDKVSGLTSVLSNFSGIKSASVSSLFGLLSPVILGFLGKHAKENNLNAGGLAGLLSSQQDNIGRAIPVGLNLGSVFGSTSVASAAPVHAASHTAHAVAESDESSHSPLRYLLPLLLFGLIAAGAYYYLGKTNDHDSKDTGHHATAVPATEQTSATTAKVTGTVDTSGNFVYELGKMVTIELPNAAGSLTVGEFSTENKLYKFLSDANTAIDTVKGNWFEFTNVRFKTGGAQVDSASAEQLKNIVAISKGFPAASFKLGGYTDNTGDSTGNVALSQKRSEAVVAALKKLGASATAITGAKGYGPQYPIGDNATAEGRAMNRRVALNVKTK